MRKFVAVVCLLCVTLLLESCEATQDKIANSLGKYDRYEFYTHNGFQDFTDYGKYYYTSANVEKNNNFSLVTAEDREWVFAYLDDYEQWIETYREDDPKEELVVNYDFDRTIIDGLDYFYIDDKADEDDTYGRFNSYNIFFFDTQTSVLYYFHNNI